VEGFLGWETGIESSTERKTKDLAAHGKQSQHMEVPEKQWNGFEWICGHVDPGATVEALICKNLQHLILMYRADL